MKTRKGREEGNKKKKMKWAMEIEKKETWQEKLKTDLDVKGGKSGKNKCFQRKSMKSKRFHKCISFKEALLFNNQVQSFLWHIEWHLLLGFSGFVNFRDEQSWSWPPLWTQYWHKYGALHTICSRTITHFPSAWKSQEVRGHLATLQPSHTARSPVLPA